MNHYIKIQIPVISAEQSEILIAELAEMRFDAFEEKENYLLAFIKEEDLNEKELGELLSEKNISYTKELIPGSNWNAKWESEFEPIVIENFVAVRAAFHKPVPGVEHEIIITPKMSFGTGHHATTYLMLQQMQHIHFEGKTVLDFGTGTGILPVMAKKLGAAKVLAIDNDEWSINNAEENFSSNNCTDIRLEKKDNLDGLDKFDIILANINLNVITKNIDGLNKITNPSSFLLLSGFLHSDEQTIINSFLSAGFKYVSTQHRNEWISVLIIKS